MELKHGKNGAGGAEISKIRHLRPKQRYFGMSKKKIYISVLVSITEKKKKKSQRASLCSPTTEKMEKKKKKKKKEKKTPKMHGGASRLRHAFDNYD